MSNDRGRHEQTEGGTQAGCHKVKRRHPYIHNNITLLQRRVWNVLLFNAYNELEKKEEHQIALKDLSTLVGYDSHDMDYLKEAPRRWCAALYSGIFWIKMDPLSGASRRCWHKGASSGCFTYAYSPKLRQLLHNPRVYARLDLNLQKQFASKYALALWELCADYLGASREYGETPFIELDTYRALMGIKEEDIPSLKNSTVVLSKSQLPKLTAFPTFR